MLNTVVVTAIDLNADLAEGATLSTGDLGVLDAVTSASLACGFHAGGRAVMRATAEAAMLRGVVLGAHVSYRDREGFGRRAMEVDPARLVADIVEQCAVLSEAVSAAGGFVELREASRRPLQPHGHRSGRGRLRGRGRSLGGPPRAGGPARHDGYRNGSRSRSADRPRRVPRSRLPLRRSPGRPR